MTLRFVTTSILSSEDGIDFGKETSVESEEVVKARKEAAAAANKPLYQQLAELRDKKQEEYDDNTKKLYAPPKGLNEDDIAFFQDLEAAKARETEANKRHEDEELEAFREARKLESLKAEEEGPGQSTQNNTRMTGYGSSTRINLPPTKKVDHSLHVGIKIRAKKRKAERPAEAENDTKTQSSTDIKHTEIQSGIELNNARNYEADTQQATKASEKVTASVGNEGKISSSSSSSAVVEPIAVAQKGAAMFADYDSD